MLKNKKINNSLPNLKKSTTLVLNEGAAFSEAVNRAVCDDQPPKTSAVMKTNLPEDSTIASKVVVEPLVKDINSPANNVTGRERMDLKQNECSVKSTAEWLSHFKDNFSSIVQSGMSAPTREKFLRNFDEGIPLKGQVNQAVIDSINHHIFSFIGRQRPSKDVCRY